MLPFMAIPMEVVQACCQAAAVTPEAHEELLEGLKRVRHLGPDPGTHSLLFGEYWKSPGKALGFPPWTGVLSPGE